MSHIFVAIILAPLLLLFYFYHIEIVTTHSNQKENMKYILNCRSIFFFVIHISKICYARILKVRKHISVIMKLNILVQSVFGQFSKHFYEKHGKDQVNSLISLLKKVFN